MFDTHCHIDLYPDPQQVVASCEANQVYTIAVTTTPSVFSDTQRLASGSRYIRPAVGLHPELVPQRWRELPLMWEALTATRYVGEIGLDYAAKSEAEKRKQRQVFSAILGRCNDAGDKILTVHSRRADADVVDAVPFGFRGTVILHWYSGSLRSLKKGLEKGCYFSVNPAMLRSKSSERLLREIPTERLLLETDGPFVQVHDRPATPADLSGVVEVLSRRKGMHWHELRRRLLANFRRVLVGPSAENSTPRAGSSGLGGDLELP